MVFPVLSNLPGLKKLKGMFTDPEERIHEFDSKSLKKILEREVQTLLKNREITDLEWFLEKLLQKKFTSRRKTF
ncbi:MAG: hypothetical protein KM296_00315 [Brockia lithotrophica]|nr:hypothetical protein [Brockia lithotrophica]